MCVCVSTSTERRREAQHASSAEVSMYLKRVERLAAPGESPVSQVKGEGEEREVRIWLGRAKEWSKGKEVFNPAAVSRKD